VSFDVDASGVLVSRYAPFLFFPDADYSVGISRSTNTAKITSNAESLEEKQRVALGKLFSSLGGGPSTCSVSSS